jgi:hypothetical protein
MDPPVEDQNFLKERELKIFTFIWNTESVRLGETLSRDLLDQHRESYFSDFHFPCEIPDFFPSLMKEITSSDADICVFAFQEDSKPGSYFHSHFLTAEMPKYGYCLVKRTKLMGVGKTTYDALFSFDFKLRGLRLSVYAKKDLAEEILEEEKALISDLGSTEKEYVCTSVITRNKGGISAYVRVPRIGTIAFINAHLPFNSQSLIDSTLRQDPMIRQNDVQIQNVCFNEIYRRLALDLPVKPDYVIYMGDFNYRIKGRTVVDQDGNENHITAYEIAQIFERRPTSDIFHKFYTRYDELFEQMSNQYIYRLNEGINNEGPMFFPTGKLIKDRPEGYDRQGVDSDLEENFHIDRNRTPSQCFRTGHLQQRCPSWCDRILYLSKEGIRQMKCQLYNRFDIGHTMKKSDHAGVIGLYTI